MGLKIFFTLENFCVKIYMLDLHQVTLFPTTQTLVLNLKTKRFAYFRHATA